MNDVINAIVPYLPHLACLFVGGIGGFFACAMMTMSKVADHNDTHRLCTKTMLAQRARIDRALEQITPGANATVKRIARILKGEA